MIRRHLGWLAMAALALTGCVSGGSPTPSPSPPPHTESRFQQANKLAGAAVDAVAGIDGVTHVSRQWDTITIDALSLIMTLTLDDAATARCEEVLAEAERAAAEVMVQLPGAGKLLVLSRCGADGQPVYASKDRVATLDDLAEQYGLARP